MAKKQPPIADLFDIPKRFHRSVQLERDFHDASALEQYVVTPSVAEAFGRVAHGLRTESRRRAWRITGDYGVGKSSFALVLAHLLNDRSPKSVFKIADAIGWRRPRGAAPLWPILLTGSRESMIPALARGIGAALLKRKQQPGRPPKQLLSLIKQAQQVETRGDLTALEKLLQASTAYAANCGAGICLIVDELGKFLEFAAQEPDREDVFVLQRLSEFAARTSEQPFLLIGLLHQGFQAYAERLPMAARAEWEKVSGRFDEIVFDQPLVHTAALVSGALNVEPRQLAFEVRDAARDAAKATAAAGWLGGGTTGAASLDVARLYPLHPTLLPVLVRFFSRFGQNERSLFSFLLSTEPFGLQSFAAQPSGADVWYRLSDFYDYVRGVFGHRLTGASYRNHWLRIVETVSGAPCGSELEVAVLKAVAILNLLDADDLLPSARALGAAFSSYPQKMVDRALAGLVEKKVLFARGIGAGYRLWPTSSVDLDGAFSNAHRHLGPITRVSEYIRSRVDTAPILARRHYLERGTLRYFAVQYVPARDLANTKRLSFEADGLIIIALAENDQERKIAEQAAGAAPYSTQSNVLVAISASLGSLAPVLSDVLCWEYVAANTPELSEDRYAAAEVARQLVEVKRSLSIRLGSLSGLRSSGAQDVALFRKGKRLSTETMQRLPTLVSEICAEVYTQAPRISNELLNRNTLSSAAAAARMRLVECMIEASAQPFLAIPQDKAPPERSMYLSVLQKGKVHVPDGDTWKIAFPEKGNDPLMLRPALEHLFEQIRAARGARVSVASLFGELQAPPFGVRDGVVPLLLAIVLCAHAHELALYESGTFIHQIRASDFLRLTKAPETFDLQHCAIQGVRVEVFNHLAAAFSKDIKKSEPDLLDVVRALCEFAAHLPEYTRRHNALGPRARAVRDHLLAATEPVSLIFRDLPQACDFKEFAIDQAAAKANRERAKAFVPALQQTINELRDTYSDLLRRIVGRVADALHEEGSSLDRSALSTRAANIALIAREPRLRAFAHRLRDPGLSDEAWAEALASFVVSKPPARWAPGDEAKFSEEIGALAEVFRKTEATAFLSKGATPSSDAVRLNLTRSDGQDYVKIIDRVVVDETLRDQVSRIEKLLPRDRASRLRLLAHLLLGDLATTEIDNASEQLTSLN